MPRLMFAVTILSICIASLFTTQHLAATNSANGKEASITKPDVNMHDYMEGMFQATYRRLKPLMAEEPKDNTGWKAIRSESLILSEGCNLLQLHTPKDKSDGWIELSQVCRDEAIKIFAAAKKKDFATSKASYESMLTHCNKCHQDFANGKHQLTP